MMGLWVTSKGWATAISYWEWLFLLWDSILGMDCLRLLEFQVRGGQSLLECEFIFHHQLFCNSSHVLLYIVYREVSLTPKHPICFFIFVQHLSGTLKFLPRLLDILFYWLDWSLLAWKFWRVMSVLFIWHPVIHYFYLWQWPE